VSESTVDALVHREYTAGFVTDIESETLPPGLDEDVVRFISARKSEPEWLTTWRLDAFRRWQAMTPPEWAHVQFPPIDFQAISYYSAPKSQAEGPRSLDEVDPELLRTYAKLGIPLHEQELLAGVVKQPPAPGASPDSAGDAASARDPAGAVAVTDAELTEAARVASRTEGIDVSPEGGAAFAAVRQLRENGTLSPKDRVVIFNTGAGWLYRG